MYKKKKMFNLKRICFTIYFPIFNMYCKLWTRSFNYPLSLYILPNCNLTVRCHFQFFPRCSQKTIFKNNASIVMFLKRTKFLLHNPLQQTFFIQCHLQHVFAYCKNLRSIWFIHTPLASQLKSPVREYPTKYHLPWTITNGSKQFGSYKTFRIFFHRL